MTGRQIQDPEHRQWRILLVYDVYRLLSILVFLGIYYFSYIAHPSPILFYPVLAFYLIFAFVFLYLWSKKNISFEKQVFISGTIDIIVISSMLGIIGTIQSGYGILLNVTIAALSILVPGRLAIFFASLASCLLLLGSAFQFIDTNSKDLGTFYYSGVYGAGFFATALTAWYLSNWVRQSETLAEHRRYELASMQKINEYIVERLHSGIIYVDYDKQIKLINSAARHFFGLGKSRVPADIQSLSPILALKFDNFLEKITQKDPIAQTILDEPFLRVHFFSSTDLHNTEVLIILEDMTYIAQQAQQLKLASLGRFSASIAHELRNPLGAIAHAVQLLGDEGDLTQEDLHLKELIINNCDRMNGVIKNVLQLSRRQQAQPQFIDLIVFLEQFKKDFCNSNQCDLIIKAPKSKQIPAVFDKSQLEQILVILCDNAIVHGRDPDGHVTIHIIIKITGSKIVLMICDDGPGIPAEHVETIFEPFFTTLRSGTGMGLFIARDLCEINQARLSLVKSKKGTTFSITLNSSDELLI